jgi:hypothetical protein
MNEQQVVIQNDNTKKYLAVNKKELTLFWIDDIWSAMVIDKKDARRICDTLSSDIFGCYDDIKLIKKSEKYVVYYKKKYDNGVYYNTFLENKSNKNSDITWTTTLNNAMVFTYEDAVKTSETFEKITKLPMIYTKKDILDIF